MTDFAALFSKGCGQSCKFKTLFLPYDGLAKKVGIAAPGLSKKRDKT